MDRTDPKHLVVIMPTWLGDVVMATPTLRALRQRFTGASISVVIGATVEPILSHCPWIDRLVTFTRGPRGRKESVFLIARRLKALRADTAVLLPNSFRWAVATRMAAVPRRVGYARDVRGPLLTDRLLAPKDAHGFKPTPTLDYYLALASYLGAEVTDKRMELFTDPAADARAVHMLAEVGIDAASHRLVLLNPGASYVAKRWPADRFAALADRLREQDPSIRVAVTGSPDERPILEAVCRHAAQPIMDLSKLGMDLGMLKSVLRATRLVVTNDTGTRHVAAAFGVPLVTLFGPTTPQWTQIDFPLERQVLGASADRDDRADIGVPRKADRNKPAASMAAITVDSVYNAARELLTMDRSAVVQGGLP